MKKKLNLFSLSIGLMLALILLIAGMLFFFNPKPKHPGRNLIEKETVASTPKPVFRKDGEVKFMDAGNEKVKISISVEIADDDAEREQGLMYRDSMPELDGMLFLFTEEEPLSFWMKNTIMPLDILYLGADHKIVTIARNAKPYSLETIPSVKPAKYVVEVNAGFSQRHGIKEGDVVAF